MAPPTRKTANAFHSVEQSAANNPHDMEIHGTALKTQNGSRGRYLMFLSLSY